MTKPMFRKVTVGLFALTLLALLTVAQRTDGQASGAATPSPIPTVPAWQLTEQQTSETNGKPAYTIIVRIPVLQSAADKSDSFNTAVKTFVSQAKDDFNKSLGDATGNPPDTSSSLT